jgi:N-methylhydantoinase A/oxoprolinase/acetone carboxylase beta subunit
MILSGPAASVVGGNVLTDAEDAVVVDMGGTTTDIALIRRRVPVISAEGISVGAWRTSVKGVYARTVGLGGDSAVRLGDDGRVALSAGRVMPLSVAAARFPRVNDALDALLKERGAHSLPLHEFFWAVKDISASERYSDAERAFVRALADGPLIFSEAARAIGEDIYTLDVRRLEREGVVMRCGLTPTDAMHLKGDFTAFDARAARLGAQFVANSAGMAVEALADRVYALVKEKLYAAVVEVLLREQDPRLNKAGVDAEVARLIARAWETRGQGGALTCTFRTDSALVGVGAPIHVFLPDVAAALGARCVIPPLSGVVNAVGAVAGSVTAVKTLTIRPSEGGCMVYGPALRRSFAAMDEATAFAREESARLAREEALRRGAAGEVEVRVEDKPRVANSAFGEPFLIECEIVATAVGSIERGE